MNPNLPVGGSATELQLGLKGALPEDITTLALSQQYVHLSRGFGGDQELAHGSVPLVQAAITSFSARHHFGQGWSADVLVPAGLVVLTPAEGHAEGPQDEHADEHAADGESRVAGFGDLSLSVGYELAALWGAGGYRPSLTLGYGLGLPTGEQTAVSPDPSVPPTFLGVGDGSFSGTWRISYTQFVHPRVALTLPTQLRVPFTRSTSNRLNGNSVGAGLHGVFLPVDELILRAGIDYEARGYADETPEGTLINSGGTWLRAQAGLTVRIGEQLAVGAGGRVPLYTNVNGEQVSETFGLDLTVAVTFGAEDEEDEEDAHEHEDEHEGEHDEHGDEHDHGDGGHGDRAEAADVADLARGGESFTLADAIVPGKVTVVDFWASWCHPCEHIDRTLRQLAARHSELAVRRVELDDFDDPVAVEHLGGEGKLPIVWIYDARGERVAELDGTTAEEVRERLLALLR